MKILLGRTRTETEALDIGYDTNGNRRHVVGHLAVYRAIQERTGMDYLAISRMPYTHALNAMKAIGGKRYHNRKYGGGIVFTLDKSELESSINEAIDTYSRWYNSENIDNATVQAAADKVLSRLPIVVKSTNDGYIVTGEYAHCAPLKIRVPYDNSLGLTENPLKAALLWANKAKFKYWQLNGQERDIEVRSDYTALDANTRVYLYSIKGY